MAWSPPALRRRLWLVEQAGDYATPLFHHFCDATADDVVRLPIARLRRDGGTQPRVKLGVWTLTEYKEDMRGGAVFPPVVVFHDGTDFWLADGFHRALAAEEAGLAEIACDVRPGTRRDAVLFAVGANTEHGQRRCTTDKHYAVERLLLDDEWSRWSDREIARRCKVSPSFVAKVREKLPQTEDVAAAAWVPIPPPLDLSPDPEPPDATEPASPATVHGGQLPPPPPHWIRRRTYTTQRGDVRVMETARIGTARRQSIARLRRMAKDAAIEVAPILPNQEPNWKPSREPRTRVIIDIGQHRLAELLVRRLLPGDRDEALRLLGPRRGAIDMLIGDAVREELLRRSGDG